MAQAINQSTTISGLAAPNVVRFPTEVAPERFTDLPNFDFRQMGATDSHVSFCVTISRELLEANIPMIARLLNSVTL